MRLAGIFSNAAAAEIRLAAAQLAAGAAAQRRIPPVEDSGKCVYAMDTGEPACLALPCRGNRIECRRTGGISFTAACRPDKCRFFTTK